jgi:hypothetical protein
MSQSPNLPKRAYEGKVTTRIPLTGLDEKGELVEKGYLENVTVRLAPCQRRVYKFFKQGRFEEGLRMLTGQKVTY